MALNVLTDPICAVPSCSQPGRPSGGFLIFQRFVVFIHSCPCNQRGMFWKLTWEIKPFIDFSEVLFCNTTVCLLARDNKVRLCLQSSLAKPNEEKKEFKWLMKHGFCPWILIGISLKPGRVKSVSCSLLGRSPQGAICLSTVSRWPLSILGL